MADAPHLRPRPLSPHVEIWRWHITMFASIMHRVAGMGIYAGALILMWWALALASGPDAYGTFTALADSLIGKLVLIAVTLGVFFHLANGVRHLFWDAGVGFTPKVADQSAWWAIGFAVVATLALWGLIAFAGAS